MLAESGNHLNSYQPKHSLELTWGEKARPEGKKVISAARRDGRNTLLEHEAKELFAIHGAQVTGDRDPGYGSTAKILGEAGACLAQDISRTEVGGGFWTPATALGDSLLARLEQHAGLTFEICDQSKVSQ